MIGHDDAVVDANILVYLTDALHLFHEPVRLGLEVLRVQARELVVLPQTEVEFWSVSTRPTDVGGLGFNPKDTSARLSELQSAFRFLPEVIGNHARWQTIVREHSVAGRQVHDARLVAAMDVYGVRTILTKNIKDFRRYSWVNAIDPGVLAQR